ncbi:shikimate dehydrogenase [Candidatus Parcubacteria bacterium]|nr:shikimate dehydrogenase [Candidatus Parcubacteria bacterium]
MISSDTKPCVGIGYPIFKSLGPIIHNAGLKAAGLDDKFVYISLNVEPSKLAQFLDFVRTSNIRGVTVTLPHKQNVMPLLDKIDPTAQEIGAVNTIVNDNGRLTGHNTDWIGASQPMKKMIDLKSKKVAVIGAGGAAKAFIYGLVKNGANVTIYNRTVDKAQNLADKFGCAFNSLEDIQSVSGADIICNASSVGFSGADQADQSPVAEEFINSGQIVFDAVYSPLKTKLLKSAARAGAKTIPGTEMLLHQGYAQFKLYYQVEAPKNEMENALLEYLDDER